MQGNKILKKILGGCSLLLLTASAFADMSLPYGWYLEGNLGSSTISTDAYPGSVSATGTGYNANIGYKFMPYISAEFGFTGYANSTITYNGPPLCRVGHSSFVFPCSGIHAATTVANTGAKAGIAKTYSWDLAAKGILPLYNTGIEAFAKVGLQRISTDVSIKNTYAANALILGTGGHSATGLYIGGGLEYFFMPELALVGQWERAQGNSSTGNGTLLSAGLQFIFG